MISIKINDQEIRSSLAKIDEFFSSEKKAELLEKLGALVEARILQRTAEGKDANLKPFKPYSKKYAAFRRKHGHSASKVNLFFRGHMLNSITHRIEEGGDAVRIFFPTPEQATKAAANEAMGREFFAINADDVGAVLDEIDRELDRALK